MIESLFLVAAGFCSVLGMAWLALSLKNHWHQVYPDQKHEPHVIRLRTTAASFLILSVLCCIIADHPSMAALVWVMLLPMAAVTVAMTLSRSPGLLRIICPVFFRLRSLGS